MSRVQEMVLDAVAEHVDRERAAQQLQAIVANDASSNEREPISWSVDRVEARNLWNIDGTRELVFPERGMTAIVGPNGSGKSSLTVNALLLGLYGAGATGNESLVRDGATSGASVRVDFTVTGSDRATCQYVVERNWSSSGRAGRAQLLRDDELVASGQKQVTDALTELLGPATVARATWVAAQGDTGRFAASAPRDRFALLADLFGFSQFAAWQQAAQKQVKAVRSELDQLIGELRAVRDATSIEPSGGAFADIPETQLRQLAHELQTQLAESHARAARVAQIDAVLRERAAVSSAARAKAEAAADELERQADRAEQLQHQAAARVAKAQSKLASLPSVEDAQARTHQAYAAASEAEQQLLHAQTGLSTAQSELFALEQALAAITRHDGGECLACGQSLDPDAASERRAELEQRVEAATALQEQCVALLSKQEEQLRVATQALTVATQDSARIAAEREVTERDLQEAQSELSMLPTVDAEQLRREASQRRAAAVTASEENRAKALAEHAESVAALPSEVDGSTAAQLEQVTAELHHRSGAAARAAAATLRLAELESRETQVGGDLAVWQAIAAACARSGVPARLIQSVLDDVNTQISESLQAAGCGLTAEIQFASLDAANPKLVIQATSGGVEVPYDSLSGGQQWVVDLAVRLALTDILSFETGVRPMLLVIDEGWGVLDVENTDCALNLLADRYETGLSVLTVTHSPSVSASAGNLVRLEPAR